MDKILFIFSAVDFKGGIPRFNRNVIDAALSSTCEIHMIVLNDAEKLPDFDGNISKYEVCSSSKLMFISKIFLHLMFHRYEKIFIGHLNLTPLIFLKYLTLVNTFADSYMFAHGVEIWGRLGRFKKFCLKNFSQCLAVSSYTANSIIEQMGLQFHEKILVFPNTIPKYWYEGMQNNTSGTLPSNLPDKYILTVSRLDKTERRKGVDDLIKTLPKIEKECCLVVVGQGNDVTYLKEIANSLNVKDRVRFYHQVDDGLLKSLYENALCFALPSDKEGFGIVYLEAMYYGVPVVGARSKGVTDVIEDQTDGLLVDYGDVDGINIVITELINNEKLREFIVKNGLSKVSSDGIFSFNMFSRRMLKILYS